MLSIVKCRANFEGFKTCIFCDYLFPEPIIKFPTTKFSIDEPTDPDDVAIVRIPIIRMGDSSQTSVVRVHTKDGSAKSGLDYNPMSRSMYITFTRLSFMWSWSGLSLHWGVLDQKFEKDSNFWSFVQIQKFGNNKAATAEF